jgi:hypothetical protein
MCTRTGAGCFGLVCLGAVWFVLCGLVGGFAVWTSPPRFNIRLNTAKQSTPAQQNNKKHHRQRDAVGR